MGLQASLLRNTPPQVVVVVVMVMMVVVVEVFRLLLILLMGAWCLACCLCLWTYVVTPTIHIFQQQIHEEVHSFNVLKPLLKHATCHPNLCLFSPAITIFIYILHTRVKYSLLYNYLFIYFIFPTIQHNLFLKNIHIYT